MKFLLGQNQSHIPNTGEEQALGLRRATGDGNLETRGVCKVGLRALQRNITMKKAIHFPKAPL